MASTKIREAMIARGRSGVDRLCAQILRELHARLTDGATRTAAHSMFSPEAALRELNTPLAFLLALYDALAAPDLPLVQLLLAVADNIEMLRSPAPGFALREEYHLQKEEVRQVLLCLDSPALDVPVYIGLVFSGLAERYMISGTTSLETTLTNEGEDGSLSSPSKEGSPPPDTPELRMVKRCLGLPETATSAEMKAAAKKKDDEGYCLMHRLAEAGHADSVEELLRAGVSPGQVGPQGQAPVHCAALNGQLAVLEVLLKFGADVFSVGSGGATPMHLAASAGHAQTVRWLADHGADIRAKNKDGQSPLHTATLGGHVEVIRTLRELDERQKKEMDERLGAVPKDFFGPDHRDDDGCTPLHLAVSAQQAEAMKVLVEEWKADLRLANRHGATPLHLAARADMGNLVRELVAWGADLGAVTNEGLSPLDEAMAWAAEGAEDVIRELGGLSAKEDPKKRKKKTKKSK